MNSMRRTIGVLLMALTSIPLWAGVTGKIAGTVIDKATHDPLPGATVMVVGTGLGAVTNLDGQYTILSIPPGFYDIQVSFIGYAKISLTDVKVNIDQTTRLNFDLEMEVIQGEAVSIVAQKTVIKEDVATSVVSVSDREVQQLPVTTVDNVVGLQAGIQGLNIRGGMADETLYLLDGAAMRDPRNNQPVSRVALSAVKEISIERGGFNAEYGQVQSGIVNVVTKEGAKNSYFGTVTGKMTPPHAKYNRENGIPDVHDPNSYWMRPYMDDAVCWTGTQSGAWDTYTRSRYPDFQGWNAVSDQLLSDNDPANDLTPLGAQRVFMYETRKKQTNDLADYEIDAGFGGPIPLISKSLGGLRFFTSYRRQRDVLIWPLTRPDYTDYDWTMQVNSDISENMKLRILGRMGNQSSMEWNWAPAGYYPHYPNEITGVSATSMFTMFSDWSLCLADIKHKALDAKLTHTLSTKTYYEVSLEYIQRQYNTRPTGLRDFNTLYEIIPGYFQDSNPNGYAPAYTGGIIVGRGEQASLARDLSKSNRLTLKADVTSQIDFNNLLKAGFEFQYNDLNLNYGFIQMQTEGKSWGSHIQMRNFPIQGSFYVQDKLETKGFTMNAGLRLDYSNSKTDWWNTDPYNPYFISSKYNPSRSFDMNLSKGQWSLSPRLGISHPITENTKLFFNYGHFKQMPQYETLFRFDRNAAGELLRLGDPNLTLAKTISYELGLDRILMNDYLIQLAAFYRDVSDQQNQTTYFPISGRSYVLTTSNTYRDIRGFELTLRKTAGRWFSGFMNYTYQVTSNGNFGQASLYQDPAAQKLWDETTVNLYQQRPMPSPYARTNLNFYTPNDFGPKVMGHPVFGNLMLNLILNWSQGGWTTYNPKNAPGITNNVQFLDDYDGTLRASKTVSFKKIKLQLLVDVGNLFDRLRLRDTGDQNYRRSLHLPASKAYDNVIPGNDKFGDYRKPGVEWQPMEYQAVVDRTTLPTKGDRAIYYEGNSRTYWQHSDDGWSEVDKTRIDQVNEDKAYIDNAGPSTYYFLNPRTVTFGARLSFDLN